MTVIFQGTNLRLNFHPCNSDVTFVRFGDTQQNGYPIETSQFPECEPGTAYQLGYNEFIVDISGNHWYQTDEIIEVIRLIEEHNPVRAKIVTFGTGMGAYAAINFAEMLDVYRYIAICPQFSLHPSHRPLEDSRWWAESKLLNFNYDYIHSGVLRDRRGYIFYDKASLDIHHAVPILNNTAGIGFHVPLFGCAGGRVLDQAYGLTEIMREVAHDEFDPIKFHADFKVKFENAVPTLVAHLENSAAFENSLNDDTPKNLKMNDVVRMIEQAYESDNAQDKRKALLAISLAEIKDADVEDIRTKKIGLLLELNLQREAILEIINSRLPHKETAELLLSQYQDLSELAALLPMLKFHPVVFRNAAFKCVKSTPERALILMKYALKSRPNNQQIKTKVIEYQKLVDGAK
ncbi:MAG: hypothetical protein ACTIKR_07610 [Advenella sp.]|uniref:Uncharacterized protein n=1 Tax=Advenella kashmirensis TaxID=310575 RepID=A0A356LHP8_9BURK|nr:hypothetical protein [Advenella kashmirensis]